MNNKTQSKKRSPLLSLLILMVLAAALYFSSDRLGLRPGAPEAQPAAAVIQTLHQEAEDSAAQEAQQAPGEKDTVFAYLKEHRELPAYYITKQEAAKLGWQGGSLEEYAPGKMIGGDRFGNYEGFLPIKSGRRWTEADIGTMGKASRGTKRIVFSSDGLIYYTEDHYKSFEKLGEMD